MSRNSKNATRTAQARKFAQVRKGGGRTGRSGSKHGKKNAWWQRFPSYTAWLISARKADNRGDRE